MKKMIALLAVLALCLCLLIGCSAKNDAVTEDYSESPSTMPSPMAPPMDAAGGYGSDKGSYENEAAGERDSAMGPGAGATAGLKIIYSCSLEIETLKYDDSLAAILGDLKTMGGYIASSTQYGGAGARYTYMTLRIPAEKYDAFLSKSGDFGTVLRRSDSTQDITGQYIDVEARLTSLKAQEARLLELVNSAADLESLILLEDKLGDVRYEIESFQSTLNTYDNLIDYCTVDITLSEVSVVTPITTKTFGQQIKDALVNSWYAVVNFLRGLVLVLIYMLPFLVIIGIVLLVVLLILKKTKPRRLERRAQRRAAVIAPPAAPGNPYSKAAPPANSDDKPQA